MFLLWQTKHKLIYQKKKMLILNFFNFKSSSFVMYNRRIIRRIISIMITHFYTTQVKFNNRFYVFMTKTILNFSVIPRSLEFLLYKN